jgi:uroporphyrinogen decarboxylase
MLTSKERIQRLIDRQPVDRIGLFEVFWKEARERWSAEGHFASPEMASDHFGLDMRRTGGEVTPSAWGLINLVANLDFGDELIEENASSKLVRNGNGAVLRWSKDRGSAPEHVSFLVKNRKDWEEHIRPHLVNKDNYRRRIAFDRYRESLAENAKRGTFLCSTVLGAFDAMNALCGHESILVGMAMDPDWIMDMCDVYATIAIEMLEMLYAQEGLPDALWMWDDLGFKQRPFMSVGMYREMIMPAHKRVMDFAHGKGLPVLLHTDGLIEPLIPLLIEAGVNILQPIEIKAGMDLLKIKKMYGDKLAFVGGINVLTMVSNDLELIRRELETKIPAVMENGGYILQVDHSCPGEVNYETYKYFVETGLRLGTYK